MTASDHLSGQQFDTPEKADGACHQASEAYAAHLQRKGIPARLVEYGYPKERFHPDSPADQGMDGWNHEEGRYESPYHHVVVEAGSRTIDWTAKQFHPDAPYPQIEPTEVARSRWKTHAPFRDHGYNGDFGYREGVT